MIDIMKEKVAHYNELQAKDKIDPRLKDLYLEILYSSPLRKSIAQDKMRQKE